MNSALPKYFFGLGILVLTGIAILFSYRNNWSASKQTEKLVETTSAKPGYLPAETNTAPSEAEILMSPTPLVSAKPTLPLDGFIYPGSSVKLQTDKKLELQSSDLSDKITDWYKNKIREEDYNAKSFTQTKSNGNVFNKLSAAKVNDKIEISIKVGQSESNVTISVDRH